MSIPTSEKSSNNDDTRTSLPRLVFPHASPTDVPTVRILAAVSPEHLETVRSLADEIFPSASVVFISDPDRALRTALEMTPDIVILESEELTDIADFLTLAGGAGLTSEIIPVLPTVTTSDVSTCLKAGASALASIEEGLEKTLSRALDVASERRESSSGPKAEEYAIYDALRRDLEEPVTSITSLGEVLRELASESSVELGEEVVEIIRRMGVASERIRDVIEDCDTLLDSTQPRTSTAQRVALRALLERVGARVESGNSRGFAEVVVDGEPSVFVDPHEVERGLQRVLEGYLSHCPAGTTIPLRAHLAVDGQVVVEILDPECGIDLFASAEPVSVAACRRIIERMGGALDHATGARGREGFVRIVLPSVPSAS